MIALRLALALTVLVAATSAAAAPVEIRTARGIGGVVVAGGVDVAVLELRSGADVALTGAVELDGRRHPVELPARGLATVTVARRLPTGASAVVAVPAGVVLGDERREVVVPSARVVARPTVVMTDAPATLVPALEPWRREAGLGEVVVVAPTEPPVPWPALLGVGALVIDRPATALPPEAGRLVRRLLAAGVKVCRPVAGPTPTCVQADALPVPHTRVKPRIAPTLGGWAWAALALAVLLAVVAALPGQRGLRGLALVAVVVVGAAVPAVGFVRRADGQLETRGVRATAGDGEDWIAAELGASELARGAPLGLGVWIEPSVGGEGSALDDVGLRGRLPGPGSWRLRGFVAADAGGWTRKLTRHPRALPELP